MARHFATTLQPGINDPDLPDGSYIRFKLELARTRSIAAGNMAEENSKPQTVAHTESPPLEHDRPAGALGEEEKKLDPEHVKRDKHGFPLVPQPSDNKDDPLVSRTDNLDWHGS